MSEKDKVDLAMEDRPEARKIKASKKLQMKVGTGKIDDKVVKQAQKTLEENKVDFAPIAMPHLNEIRDRVAEVKKSGKYGETSIEEFSMPIMNLKANAGSFDYETVGDMASTVLMFLENLDKLDKKVVQIIDLLHKTVLLIIAKEMKGKNHPEGKALIAAFQEVCQKYKRSA